MNISEKLLSELLPGPVTVVLERTAELNPDLNRGTSLVGVRIPDYDFIRDLTRACDEPLALTSANISNGPSAVNIQVRHVLTANQLMTGFITNDSCLESQFADVEHSYNEVQRQASKTNHITWSLATLRQCIVSGGGDNEP